jgi:hypothetical protein
VSHDRESREREKKIILSLLEPDSINKIGSTVKYLHPSIWWCETITEESYEFGTVKCPNPLIRVIKSYLTTAKEPWSCKHCASDDSMSSREIPQLDRLTSVGAYTFAK